MPRLVGDLRDASVPLDGAAFGEHCKQRVHRAYGVDLDELYADVVADRRAVRAQPESLAFFDVWRLLPINVSCAEITYFLRGRAG